MPGRVVGCNQARPASLLQRGFAMARTQLSKKQRFDVFKRDAFTCQYCGRTPPAVVLECDHITAVKNGGGNVEENLVTSCFDCNRGKCAADINIASMPLADRAAIIAEKEAQLHSYQEILAARRARIEAEAFEITRALRDESPIHRRDFLSIKRFLDDLGFDEVAEAAEIARAAKPYSHNRMFRYFCGVCWNKINRRSAANG